MLHREEAVGNRSMEIEAGHRAFQVNFMDEVEQHDSMTTRMVLYTVPEVQQHGICGHGRCGHCAYK